MPSTSSPSLLEFQSKQNFQKMMTTLFSITNYSILLLFFFFLIEAEAKCKSGCELALASYTIREGVNLTYISTLFNQNIPQILLFNPPIPNQYSIPVGVRINIPFSCDCLNAEFLGHTFNYTVQSFDTYDKIASTVFANLTTRDWIYRVNIYDPARIPENVAINVTVNCSCGDNTVSSLYGLFATYPLRSGQNLSSLAVDSGVPPDLLQRYNPALDFSAGSGIAYVPARDANGRFPPLKTRAGISSSVIAGIAVAGGLGALLLIACVYVRGFYPRKNLQTSSLSETSTVDEVHYDQLGYVHSANMIVDKSVEFSYQELATATNDFNISNKIGQGGFGTVYYAQLSGKRAAIKKMEMQASKEFLAELKVLTHVHHLNLVHLIGFCVDCSLCLVYEFVENGNLSQHLHGSDGDTLPWLTRVQIALDSARGLQYIHELTVPGYVHRDVKSTNILIDENFRGKVADFGLTVLTELGNAQKPRRAGTFGYMPPECAENDNVSPKIDVYAFGVVLYELISAKQAVLETKQIISEFSTQKEKIITLYKPIIDLFEDALSQPDPREELCKLIDPRLGDNYPLDSIYKVAQLAKACTHENPQQRPSMRSIVVALQLSSSTENWDEKSSSVNQMAGR